MGMLVPSWGLSVHGSSLHGNAVDQRRVACDKGAPALEPRFHHPGASASSRRAPAATLVTAGVLGSAWGVRHQRRSPRQGCRGPGVAVTAVPGAETLATAVAGSTDTRPKPLQVIKIDLETNRVLVGEEEILRIQMALKQTGVQKIAVVGVMGAFRTGKSFLLDLMLRYLRHTDPARVRPEVTECEVPQWINDREVPDWAVECGASMVEGREGSGDAEREGFIWRPGMEKCTEGVWFWSEAFVRKAGDEDVAVLLMDTQGAWDARMTKEQSATVFGLTTLLTSRLVYNVSKQIQQDKIDNLLYFTDMAQAALRTKESSLRLRAPEGLVRPFQALEFLVRDWPHYPEGQAPLQGRSMMVDHLRQYSDTGVSEDTKSMDTLQGMFSKIDIWCLPHPSLSIEKQSWDGDLSTIERSFWRFVDAYFDKIFSPTELSVKTTLGTPITVDAFPEVLCEFIAAFGNAAPQAQSFAEAMQTSTSLLARDLALKRFRSQMEAASVSEGLATEEFDRVAASAVSAAEEEFGSRALFGSEEGISRVADGLKADVAVELERYREDNERRLEASLSGLTDVSLAAVAAFGLDRASDFTCDWWSSFCRDLSNDLSFGYLATAAYVAYCVSNIQRRDGQLSATVATFELGKSMVRRVGRFVKGVETD